MLERIGDVILRFKSYERLFPTHESLIHSLSLVYLDVLEFCIQAKNLFQKAKKHKCEFTPVICGNKWAAIARC